MGDVPLRYVKSERDRHGRALYWYFRRAGRRWRLPGNPSSPGFLAAYQALLASTVPAQPDRPHAPKSVGALARDYYGSPEFRDRKPRTQVMYRRVIDWLVEKYGHDPVARIERRHVKRWRDERSETPGMANMVVKVVSLLLDYAVENEYREDNPARKIKLYKLGEHRAWTDAECKAFEARWPPGTMERRCYELAGNTGQRAGDLARMTRAHRRDGRLEVKQEKTGKELKVPETQELTDELARGEQGHMSLLTKAGGSAFKDGNELGIWFAAAIEAAGLPDDCVLHGLRKLTAKKLAERGCSAHEIASITGHNPQSPEITRYTRQADQVVMAEAAILKFQGNVDRTRTGKRGRGRSGKRKLER
jgi:integrase